MSAPTSTSSSTYVVAAPAERPPVQHHLAILSRANDAIEIGEVDSRVHAAQLVAAIERQRLDAESTPIDLDEIRQVVLALRVVGGQTMKRVEQRFERQGVNAAVHFVERALVSRASFSSTMRSMRPAASRTMRP